MARNNPEFTKYSPEIRDKALALAKKIGVNAAADKLRISRSRVTTWRQRSGDAIPRPGARKGRVEIPTPRLLPTDDPSNGNGNGLRQYHTAEEKARALGIIDQIGVQAASTQLGIPTSMLYRWKKSTTPKATTYAPHPAWLEGFAAGFARGLKERG